MRRPYRTKNTHKTWTHPLPNLCVLAVKKNLTARFTKYNFIPCAVHPRADASNYKKALFSSVESHKNCIFWKIGGWDSVLECFMFCRRRLILVQNVSKNARSIFSITRKTPKRPNFNQFDASALRLTPVVMDISTHLGTIATLCYQSKGLRINNLSNFPLFFHNYFFTV